MDELHCRHFILCHTVWANTGDEDAPLSLGRMVVAVRPTAGSEFGFLVPRLFAYLQLSGPVDDYTVRIRLVRVEREEDGKETETGVSEFGPWDVQVSGLMLADSFATQLLNVPFETPGLYEFQLWADDPETLLAVERIEARR